MFAASTSLSAAAGAELQPQHDEALAIIRALQNNADPIDIELSDDRWARALRRMNPTRFRTDGAALASLPVSSHTPSHGT